MRILVVSSPWLGGSGTVALELARELSKRHFVVLASFDFPLRFSQEKDSRFVLVNLVPASYSLFPYPLYQTSLTERLVELIERYKIDIVHAHYSLVFGEAAALAKKIVNGKRSKSVKFFLTFHGTDLVGFDPRHPGKESFKKINQWLIEVAEKVTTPSRFMKDLILKIHRVPEEKIKVIPNFVNLEIFRRQLGYSERKYITHISNFRKVKRADEVLSAFKSLNLANGWLKLLFIGEGPEKGVLKVRVRKEKIKNVIFENPLDPEKIALYLNQSLVTIYPSLFENFPLVALESLACGTPAIISKVGGVPEVVPENCGILIKNIDNPQREIIAGVKKIIKNEKRWEEFSNNTVLQANKFATKKIIKLYENVYRN